MGEKSHQLENFRQARKCRNDEENEALRLKRLRTKRRRDRTAELKAELATLDVPVFRKACVHLGEVLLPLVILGGLVSWPIWLIATNPWPEVTWIAWGSPVVLLVAFVFSLWLDSSATQDEKRYHKVRKAIAKVKENQKIEDDAAPSLSEILERHENEARAEKKLQKAASRETKREQKSHRRNVDSAAGV